MVSVVLLKSIRSAISSSVDRIGKFVSFSFDMVDCRYVKVSFSCENERSQPATEAAIVNKICNLQSNLRIRKHVTFANNKTINFRIPKGVS